MAVNVRTFACLFKNIKKHLIFFTFCTVKLKIKARLASKYSGLKFFTKYLKNLI